MEKYIKNPKDIIHFSQLNNRHEPFAACFPTSLAMALRNNGYKYDNADLALDDYIFELAATPKYKALADRIDPAKRYKPHQYAGVMCAIANDLMLLQGIKKTAKYENYTIARVRAQVDQGNMMVAGTYFTNYGHMICISGYTDDSIIINDPYGNPNEFYHFNDGNKLDDGALVKLDRHLLAKISYLITF